MSVTTGLGGLLDAVQEALATTAERVCQSLVLVRSGEQGSGAGIIWRPNGVVVTNHHVVARGHPRVTLADDREFDARVVGTDPSADLAVLQIDAIGLPAAPIGDTRNLRVGQLVLAVGNPWGQRGIVTAGIISGLGVAPGRRDGGIPYIRSDVTLAPGNSGGPMVDATGAVIGINAMIFGGDLSVAIPSDSASALVAESYDRRVVLGVGVRPVPLPEAIQSQVGRAQAAGLMVVELAPNGPAERAGLVPGDILVALGPAPLDEPRALVRALAAYDPGARVPLRVVRAGHWHQAEAELEARVRVA